MPGGLDRNIRLLQRSLYFEFSILPILLIAPEVGDTKSLSVFACLKLLDLDVRAQTRATPLFFMDKSLNNVGRLCCLCPILSIWRSLFVPWEKFDVLHVEDILAA